MGIDYLTNPDMAITTEIYKYLVEKYSLSNGIFQSGKISLLEFKVSKMPRLIGIDMNNISTMLEGILVVAISRKGKIIIPHGDTTIERGDGIYLIGERGRINDLSKKVHEKGKYNDLQKVMIIGGGKTGLYLANMLTDFNISVKIIERSKERCYYLSEHLENVMILHGDGTDISLLEEENIDDMDALVTATGFDEDNLLLALMAKERGIEDVIAKVSRGIYTELISNLGVDMALNPLDITVSNILRIIQGSKRVISSELIQGQAEIMELVAAPHMKLLGKPIRTLKLPKGTLIAAIRRGSEAIIPNGDTVIHEEDHIILICLLSEVTNLEKVLRTGRDSDVVGR